MWQMALGRQTFYSFGLSGHPLANEWRAVPQDHSLPLRRGEETNGVDVCEPQLVEVQRRWSAIQVELRAHMCDMFGPHVADQTNRRSVFPDVRDDPESHSPREPTQSDVAMDTPILGPLGQRLTDVDVPNCQNLLISR